jgi:hypothetical protein
VCTSFPQEKKTLDTYPPFPRHGRKLWAFACRIESNTTSVFTPRPFIFKTAETRTQILINPGETETGRETAYAGRDRILKAIYIHTGDMKEIAFNLDPKI